MNGFSDRSAFSCPRVPSSRFIRLLFPFLIFLTSTLTFRAALHWETTEILLTPKSTSASATAEFVFTNRGATEVFIEGVQPDCSCVTMPLAKMQYMPGESGRLAATFAVGHQTGEVTVPIQIRSRDGLAGATNSTVLLLRVKIAEVVTFSPRFLYWKKGEPLGPKMVNVSILHGELITLKEVRAGNPAYRAELQPTKDQERFILKVAPPADGSRSVCPLTIISESKGNPATKNEHAMIARVL